jgi:hypothetical protein
MLTGLILLLMVVLRFSEVAAEELLQCYFARVSLSLLSVMMVMRVHRVVDEGGRIESNREGLTERLFILELLMRRASVITVSLEVTGYWKQKGKLDESLGLSTSEAQQTPPLFNTNPQIAKSTLKYAYRLVQESQQKQCKHARKRKGEQA